ncbi:Wzz/FepE/Etk N-terminal domain-containing protein [Peribacillus frigoritolerans]|uniref:YveK family protein n=1 Tax=Peribacillus frigoritolerans TaxID=450367 RepID=UPI0022262F6E|nr:Wzz/FepE/Etk N-terminal domain-containing protein [Peribacillus frigoritolerans]UYY97441.1 Wzz/FepE/Etk N-terminal domain-containing protein [Peribacillus frigoritolerans]
MEETISIKDIFKTLKERWKLIMLLTLIAALISGSISYFLLTPVYESSTQILVNQKQSETQLDSNQIRSNIDMINTYSVIIKSPAILEKVIEELNLDQSVDQLSEKITINSQENSQVFSLTVQDSNPIKAVKIANAVSGTFQKEIKDIMNVDNVSVLAKAEIKENPTPVKPNPVLNIAIAVVVGLMAGVGLAFLLEYMDNTIKDEDDIERLLELPILGSIQKITQVHNKG